MALLFMFCLTKINVKFILSVVYIKKGIDMNILQTLTDSGQELAPKKDSIQKYRFFSQLFSIAINIWIGIEFYLFILYLQDSNPIEKVIRPPGVEAWLPIGSLVSLKHYIQTGIVNNIHPAGMMIFITILLTAFLFKKGFCSWICPVGFIEEMLGDLSDKFFKKRLKLPKWLDYPLRSLKYIILIFFANAIILSMSSLAIEGFIYTDYNIASDFLMMKFFTDITPFALKVVIVLVALSLIIRGFWCRYLCPYGALLGLFNFISPTRIVRNEKSCIDCSSCTAVCPSFIKVEKVQEVISDECTGCMACVDICPVQKTLEVKVVKKSITLNKAKWAAILLIFFWGSMLGYKYFGPWQNEVTDSEYRRILPIVDKGQMTHP